MRKQIHSGSRLPLWLLPLALLWASHRGEAQVASFEFYKHTWHRDNDQTRYAGSLEAEWFYFDEQTSAYKALNERLILEKQSLNKAVKFKLTISDLKLKSENSYRYLLKIFPSWIGPEDCFQMLEPRILSLEPPHSPAEILFEAENLPQTGQKEVHVDFTIVNNTYQDEHIALGENNRVRLKKSFFISSEIKTPPSDSSAANLKADIEFDGRALNIANVSGGQKPYLLVLIKQGEAYPSKMLELPDSTSYSLNLKEADLPIGRYDVSVIDATRKRSIEVKGLAVRNASGSYLGGLLLLSIMGMFACIFIFLRREKIK